MGKEKMVKIKVTHFNKNLHILYESKLCSHVQTTLIHSSEIFPNVYTLFDCKSYLVMNIQFV